MSWNYDVIIYVNNDAYVPSDPNQFKFSVNFTNIDVVQSSLTFLGYQNQSVDNDPLDCTFVNNYVYAIIDMKDLYGNDVKYDQYDYWGTLIDIFFEEGSGFETIHCRQYTGIENTQWYEHLDPS